MTDAEIVILLLITAHLGIWFLIWGIIKLAARQKIQYELTNCHIETLLKMVEAEMDHIAKKRKELKMLGVAMEALEIYGDKNRWSHSADPMHPELKNFWLPFEHGFEIAGRALKTIREDK